MKKRIISMLLAVVLLLGMLPFASAAEAEIPVTENVIDITDRSVYSISKYYVNATDITVDGAKVVEAYEDGTTVRIVLDAATPDDGQINVAFGTARNGCEIKGNTSSLTLSGGQGTLSMSLKGYYRMESMGGTVGYTLVFTREEAITAPPVRVTPQAEVELYKGTVVTVDLSDYFSAAKEFYLLEGETWTPLQSNRYTYAGREPGTHTLTFGAGNELGRCPEPVTVIFTVKDVESGVYVGHTTSSGSMDTVLFTDGDGNPIEGLSTVYANKQITVTLPKTYALDGKVTAAFSLTQNESGYPFLSTKTATVGVSSGKAVNNKFTEKTTTLSGGAGALTFYYFNSAPTGSNQETFTLFYKMANDLPVLAPDVAAVTEATITAGESYALDLGAIFTDADDAELTYFVSVNGAAAVAADTNYTYTADVAGTYTLVFTASDGKDPSTETYTVTLTVENAQEQNAMTVLVPQDAAPAFYVSTGFGSDGLDLLGQPVQAAKGDTADGMTAYTVSYPVNAAMLSVRAENRGGMAFVAEKDGTVTLRQVQLLVTDYDGNSAESTNTVTYGGHTAAQGTEGWLLAVGGEYTFTAVPKAADLAKASKTEVLEAGAEKHSVCLMLGISNPFTLTVPNGAKANLYKCDTSKYYFYTEAAAKIVTDNGNGTTTYSFAADTKNGTYVYHVTMDGKATKAGWIGWGKQNVTVTFGEGDKAADYRLEDYSATGAANGNFTEDSVLLNINSRNHLTLSVGGSKVLKAYRAWEIIPISYQNYILTPDFTYTVLSGGDVISLTEKTSPSAADGDWMTLTALQEGVAVIEVTYDAMEVTGGSYDGIYGASDPARTGLVVVQVGGAEDPSVDFGIQCRSSFGSTTYSAANAAAWDAEFDTLYFTGESGQMTMQPTAESEILEVAVSNDKGATWDVLTASAGEYTAKIVSGNNILRVTTASGTAYQVVRGDKLTVTLAEVTDKSDGDGILEAGETVRVTLKGLHAPIPKMSGNYNPGATDSYAGNGEKQRIKYTLDGVTLAGPEVQYNLITQGNYVDVAIPADFAASSLTLTDGYIGLGVIGLTAFTKGGDSHRNIPDSGCGTRQNNPTAHTRSMLPDITVTLGSGAAENTAPIVRADAVTEGSIYADQKFAVNPDTLFLDPDGNPMTFTVSVNGAEAVEAPVDYKFTPAGAGVYTLAFIASDGKETAQHTVTVTVTERTQGGTQTDAFGLSQSEIAGYATISFEDNATRVQGETGLKYPVPLGTIIPATQVPFKQGENIAQVTKRLLDHLGIGMRHTGTLTANFYLGAITDFEVNSTPYVSMGEFDAGSGSGWMITQNTTFIGQGASQFFVQNGDRIRWQYTCQLGADIGDAYWKDKVYPGFVSGETSTEEKQEDKQEGKPLSFTDVKQEDYFYDAVKWAAEQGITGGTSETAFSPAEYCTRAQMVTFLWRAAGCPKVESTCDFTDVDEMAYYYEALAWAVSEGITTGTGDGAFSPEAVCSRSQMMTFLYRSAKMPAVSGSHNFSDVQADAYYHDAVLWAAAQCITNGTSDSTFSPEASCTRGQTVTFLYRYLGNA